MRYSEIQMIDRDIQTSLQYISHCERQNLEKELQKLREEKFLLEGKIKGYSNLGDICREYQEELALLREQYTMLQEKINMSKQIRSNESPSPDDDYRTGNGHEKDNFNNTSMKHSSSSITNNVASSILEEQDTHVRTGELFEANDSNSIAKATALKQRYQDKFPMQESLPPDSFTGMGFVSVPNGTAGSGDLMRFSIAPQKETEENQIREILNSVPIDERHIPEMRKVVAVVKSFSDAENKKLTTDIGILQEEIKTLKAENSHLIKKLRQFEDASPSSNLDSPAVNGWVHVEKQLEDAHIDKHSDERQQNISFDELRLLKQNNAQLKEANQRWSSEWNKLQRHYEDRLSELQAERDKLTKELTDLKISEESRVKEYEKMLLNAKSRANEEENAKEEAFLQLTTVNNKLESLQSQLAQAEETITVLKREKLSLDTEINILRQRPEGQGAETPIKSKDTRSLSDIKTENDVLRQQLLVFQEDFNRERTDRAKAQSSKDEYKKQNELLKKRARQVEERNTMLERQVMNLEDTIKKLNDEKAEFMKEISTQKLQLQREKEKLASPNLNGYQHPIIQSAGLQQTVPQPMQYRVPANYNQYRMPQLNGLAYGRQNSGSPYQAVSPPGAYYPMNPAEKQTEIQAGAWTCGQCTYVNYPGRTVCEMCGYIRNASSDGNSQSRSSGNETLHPRGEHLLQPQLQQQQRPPARQPVFQRPSYGQFVASP